MKRHYGWMIGALCLLGSGCKNSENEIAEADGAANRTGDLAQGLAEIEAPSSCDNDNQCTGKYSGGRCLGASSRESGRCGCVSSIDCKGSPPRSCLGTGTSRSCREPCKTKADCRDPSLALCDTNAGACVQCLSNADCSTDPHKPVCNPQTRSCVDCLTSADCQNNPLAWGPTCTQFKLCRCEGDGDCRGNKNGESCSYTRCGCKDSGECKFRDRSICLREDLSTVRKVCQKPCASPQDCSARTPFCNLKTSGAIPTGLCIECELQSQCKTKTKPFCSPRSGQCVTCLGNKDCENDPSNKSSGFTICRDTGFCGQCQTPSDCGRLNAKLCTVWGTCRECETDGDCTGHSRGPICAPNEVYKCSCVRADQCAAGMKCDFDTIISGSVTSQTLYKVCKR